MSHTTAVCAKWYRKKHGLSWKCKRGTSFGLEVRIKSLEEVTFSWVMDSEQSFQGQHSTEEGKGHCKQDGRLYGEVGSWRGHSELELNKGLCGVGVESKKDTVNRWDRRGIPRPDHTGLSKPCCELQENSRPWFLPSMNSRSSGEKSLVKQ